MGRIIKLKAKKKTGAAALLSLPFLLVLLVFCLALALLIFVTRQIFYYGEPGFDEGVFLYLSHQITDAHTLVMRGFTFLGSHIFLIPAWAFIFGYYTFIKKNKWNFIKAVVISVSSLLLMFGLKFFFSRLRPPVPLLNKVPGFSFPSGHAFMSLTFFGFLIYIIYREAKNPWLKWAAIFILTITMFMVGLSRVYLRLHYASDVIAGYCFSILSLIILLCMLQQVEKMSEKKLSS